MARLPEQEPAHNNTVDQYLISAPPRVGGNLIADIIKSAGNKTFLKTVHTHDPRYVPDDCSSTALILVKRRDAFASIMSNCIVWHTQQSTIYSNQTVAPFAVSEEDFLWQCGFNIWYSKSVERSRPYAVIEEFYFEDFENNHHHVLDRLGLVSNPFRARRLNFLNKAPYSYSDVVLNYKQLKVLFDGLDPERTTNPYSNVYQSVLTK